VKPDAAGNLYPAKAAGANKIDAAVALISALSRATLAESPAEWGPFWA
jgi:phage terminase large subunit-like protein